MRSVSASSLALVLAVTVVLSAGAGASVTHAYFVDSVSATGSVTAAQTFGGDRPDGHAYNDANGNGRYDDGEETFTADDLVNFDDQNANLVIPDDVGQIRADTGNLQIQANSISGDVDLRAQNGQVKLETSGGDVALGGSEIWSNKKVQISSSDDVVLENADVDSQNNQVQVTANGLLDLDGADVDSNKKISLRGQRVTARNADIDSQNNHVILEATRNGGGELDATGATLSTGTGKIQLASNGDMTLDSATLDSQNGDATADLGGSSYTLSVDQTVIQDRDSMLVYDPDGIDVVGAPNGDVNP